MAARWNRQAITFSRCGFFLSSIFFYILSFFLAKSQRSEIGCLPYFDTWCGPNANLECRSETCCTRLAEIQDAKSRQNRNLGTIAQLCPAISLQLRHISTIGKKLLSSNISSTCPPQYGELRPTSGWDRSGSLRHPCKFQRVSRLGSVTARHCSSGRQPNFAALNRGCHLYRPMRQGGHHVGHWPTFLVP